MSHYLRVIPRDLFNEGNLLKCYGQIYLNLERLNVDAQLLDDGSLDDGSPFRITQDLDGNLTVLNVYLRVRGTRMPLRRPLNARSPYPLYMGFERYGEEDELAVFNDDGTFSKEMLDFLKDE